MADRRAELADLFRELAELTTLEEESAMSFRVRAYEGAVQAIRNLPPDFHKLESKDLVKRHGIGKSTAEKIHEFLETGKLDKLEKLREKWPASVVEVSRISGIGPKTVKKLREIGVESVADLKKALAEGRVQKLAGFGKKSAEKIAEAVDKALVDKNTNRIPIARAMPVAVRLCAELRELPFVEAAEYCGSLRRLSETIGDVDILVASDDPAAVMDAFVGLSDVGEVVSKGEKKSSVRTKKGLQVDCRVVAKDQLGAALMYFTGSKTHNIKLRQLAIEKGWTLNEYALSVEETGEVVAKATEEEIYAKLGLAWIPPPMREDSGEIELAAEGKLPTRVEVSHMRGDLHVHTDRSGDAHSPIAEVVEAAIARGYQYLALTDHAEDLPMNGVSRAELLEQREEIARLRDQHDGFEILQGIELNIGPDGGLDYDQDFRMSLDFCVAAVHSHFDLSRAEQTKRILAAMQNPAVNVIGHLSGRMIGKRAGIDLEIDEILHAAKETHTAIEINAALPRLDAAADVVRRGAELGVTFVISTDTHHVVEFERMQWGALQAQRGFLPRELVANTWSKKEFLAWVAEKRAR